MKQSNTVYKFARSKRNNKFGNDNEFCSKAERIAQVNRRRNKYRNLDQNYEDRFYR